MALIALCKLNLQTHMRSPSNGATRLIFGQTLRLLPYFMCANSEGSGETARMRRIAWAFAGRLCDKYHNLMSWLNYNAMTQNKCIVKGSHKYDVYLFDKAHINLPNKDQISIMIYCNVIQWFQ